MKRNNLNHIDYKNLPGSNDPWFCIFCCYEIFPFGTLANKNLSMMMVNSSTSTVKNIYINANNINSTSLIPKPYANWSLLFNHFNNFSPEQKNMPENVMNSNYYDIHQFQTLIKFYGKNKSLSLFHINACSLSKKFDGLEHLLKCTNNAFYKVEVSETRITAKKLDSLPI